MFVSRYIFRIIYILIVAALTLGITPAFAQSLTAVNTFSVASPASNFDALIKAFTPFGDMNLIVDDQAVQALLPLSTQAVVNGQQAFIKASNSEDSDHFGSSLAISGNTVVVGAPNEDSSATGMGGNQEDNLIYDSGAAYVFIRNGSIWSQQAYIKASNTESGDLFATSVAISGDTLVVGAPHEDSSATGVNGNQADNSADESGAVYVFTRVGNDWSQQAYIKASNTNTGDRFGSAVAISGDTLVVGAFAESSNAIGVNGIQTDNSVISSGAVYVFTRIGNVWSQQAYIKASNRDAFDWFGASVAISGDTLAVSAPHEASNATGIDGNQTDNSASMAGAVYVFMRSGADWSQQAYIKASNTDAGDDFGHSIALFNDTLVVGADGEDSNGSQNDNSVPNSGAAYVFTRSSGVWSQQAYLKASNSVGAGLGGGFGSSLAVFEDTLVVGVYQESSGATGINGDQNDTSVPASGAAYLLTRTGVEWSQHAYIKASNTGEDDFFTSAIAVSGDTVIIGAANEDSYAWGINGDQNNDFSADSGAVYIFGPPLAISIRRASANPTIAASVDFDVTFSEPVTGVDPGDFQLTTSGLSGTSIANISGSGATYTVTVTTGSGTGSIRLNLVDDDSIMGATSNPLGGTGTGNGDFTSGQTYTIDSPFDQVILKSQQAYIKASNTDADDGFYTVAISGDTMVVGARYEGSNAVGINGNQADNSTPSSGAVYVFTRNGIIWSQQAYIKASNTEAGDQFGYSVAISGDTLVVGAPGEDSNATGVNGNQANNSGLSSGAAYVFTRSGTTWSQQAYIKASNTNAGDQFGLSVAIDSDTVVIGTPYEDSSATGINGNQADNSASSSGAAYVFTRSGTTWSQQAYIKASNAGQYDSFAENIDISGDSIVVGAYDEDSNATGINGNQADNSALSSGAVYVFTRSGTTWSQQAYIKASNAAPHDFFGMYVTISMDSIAVASVGYNANATGTVYIFTRSGTAWSEQTYLEASNDGISDLDLAGDILVVGSSGEDSNATGINGNKADNSASNAGAAYAFLRNGTNWSQSTYVKASNTEAGDRFGCRAAVSNTTVVLAACAEDSNAIGVDGNQSNNLAPGSGAVYVFVDAETPPTATPTITRTPTITPTVTITPTITRTPAPVGLTFYSIAAQDGWVLESSETSGKGGTRNVNGTTFNLGDNAAKKQYRGILSFNTGAALPDNAVITSVKLKIKKQGVVGSGNPLKIFQGFKADIKKGMFGGKAALQNGDFQAAANKTYGPFTPSLVSGWYTINLTSAKAYINKLSTGGGLTQIRLRFKLDDNNDAQANILKLYSGNATAANRPQLVITYYVP